MSRIRVMEVVECGGHGGTGYQVAAVCNSLDSKRFEMNLVYSVRPGCSPQEYEGMARGAQRFFYVPEMVRELSPVLDLKAWWKLYRLFRVHRPDIVHAHSSKAGFLARTAAWTAGVRRIYFSPRGYSFLQTDRLVLSRWLYRLLERSVAWIGVTVPVSYSEEVLARALGARRIHTIRDAYLGEVGGPVSNGQGEEPRATIVCASGRLSFPRHPEAFVRLAQRLTDSRNRVRCLWIGDGDLGLRLRQMLVDMNLPGKFEITGWLSHAQVQQRLRAADIFVHYSRWEGLPSAVLEAMAQGLPVVASDVCGNRDVVRSGENGFLVTSEVELLERTLELIDHPELRRRLGAQGRDLVRSDYSLGRMVGEYTELYSCAAPVGHFA